MNDKESSATFADASAGAASAQSAIDGSGSSEISAIASDSSEPSLSLAEQEELKRQEDEKREREERERRELAEAKRKEYERGCAEERAAMRRMRLADAAISLRDLPSVEVSEVADRIWERHPDIEDWVEVWKLAKDEGYAFQDSETGICYGVDNQP